MTVFIAIHLLLLSCNNNNGMFWIAFHFSSSSFLLCSMPCKTEIYRWASLPSVPHWIKPERGTERELKEEEVQMFLFCSPLPTAAPRLRRWQRPRSFLCSLSPQPCHVPVLRLYSSHLIAPQLSPQPFRLDGVTALSCEQSLPDSTAHH